MKYMAIDYGDARTGVAFSDPTGTLAGETLVVHEQNLNRLVAALAELAESRHAEGIVLGYPLNMNNTTGPRAEKCQALKTLLEEKSERTVNLWDERLSTVEAHRILNTVNARGKKRKNTVDAVAASLILEGFLASKNGAGRQGD